MLLLTISLLYLSCTSIIAHKGNFELQKVIACNSIAVISDKFDSYFWVDSWKWCLWKGWWRVPTGCLQFCHGHCSGAVSSHDLHVCQPVQLQRWPDGRNCAYIWTNELHWSGVVIIGLNFCGGTAARGSLHSILLLGIWVYIYIGWECLPSKYWNIIGTKTCSATEWSLSTISLVLYYKYYRYFWLGGGVHIMISRKLYM